MLNLIFSILAGAAAWGISLLIFDSIWSGLLPFFIVFIVAFILFNRMTQKKISAIMNNAQSMMMNVQSLPSELAKRNLIDKCIAEFKKAYAYNNYAFFLKQQINSQIGSLYYVQKRFKDAEPYLKDGFPMQGPTMCMYGCLLYKDKKEKEMIEQFEKTVKFNKKEPLYWNVYAWCLNQLKKRDEAIAVLNRCLAQHPSDKITRDNLDLLKNSAKVKMTPYEMQWYQFLLEDPPQAMIQKMLLDKHSVVRSR